MASISKAEKELKKVRKQSQKIQKKATKQVNKTGKTIGKDIQHLPHSLSKKTKRKSTPTTTVKRNAKRASAVAQFISA